MLVESHLYVFYMNGIVPFKNFIGGEAQLPCPLCYLHKALNTNIRGYTCVTAVVALIFVLNVVLNFTVKTDGHSVSIP